MRTRKSGGVERRAWEEVYWVEFVLHFVSHNLKIFVRQNVHRRLEPSIEREI